MIVLFSDFGLEGPYIGQVKAALFAAAPGVPVIDLFSDAPAFDPQLSAYLLAAYADAFAPGTVFLAVVDPGVGSERPCIVLQAGGRWFVGPGNGLFEIAARRAEARGEDVSWWSLDAVPAGASASFHGRDVFAPLAAQIAVQIGGGVDGQGVRPHGCTRAPGESLRCPDWPDDLAKVVYIDVFGNAMTGLRAVQLGEDWDLFIGDKTLPRARTFSDVPTGAAFWYENGNGLAEIAVNRGRASDLVRAKVGDDVAVSRKPA